MKKLKSVLPFLLFAMIFCCTESDYKLIADTFDALADKQEVSVVVVGDSISSDDKTGGGSSWGRMLKPMLSDFLDARVSVINSSRPDLTFDMARRYYQEDVFSFRPDVILVMLGMTETATGSGTFVVRDTAKNYFDILAKRDVLVIVLTLTGYRDMEPAGNVAKSVDAVNAEIVRQARLHHFPVIDITDRMRDVQLRSPQAYRNFFENEVFLSEHGSRFVAETIMDTIRRTVERMR